MPFHHILHSTHRLSRDERSVLFLCVWMDFVDGVLTAHNLDNGNLELNLWMAAMWRVSPLLYANVKFASFWVGAYFINHAASPSATRMRIFLMVLGGLLAVNVLHVRILWLAAQAAH